MCVVSMIIDEAHKQWPPINPFSPVPSNPFPWDKYQQLTKKQESEWDSESLKKLKEIITKLGELDKKLGAKDCYDPKKEKFLEDLDKRIKQLEENQDRLIEEVNRFNKLID